MKYFYWQILTFELPARVHPGGGGRAPHPRPAPCHGLVHRRRVPRGRRHLCARRADAGAIFPGDNASAIQTRLGGAAMVNNRIFVVAVVIAGFCQHLRFS